MWGPVLASHRMFVSLFWRKGHAQNIACSARSGEECKHRPLSWANSPSFILLSYLGLCNAEILLNDSLQRREIIHWSNSADACCHHEEIIASLWKASDLLAGEAGAGILIEGPGICGQLSLQVLSTPPSFLTPEPEPTLHLYPHHRPFNVTLNICQPRCLTSTRCLSNELINVQKLVLI